MVERAAHLDTDGRGFGDLALFLDLDGTLIDIAAEPTAAFAPAGLVEQLERLSLELDGALAILSGRAIAAIDGLLAPMRPRAAGVHGSEFREEAGGAITRMAPDVPPDLVREIRALLEFAPGIVVEMKGPALATHFRLAPELGLEVERRLQELLPRLGGRYELRPGRMVLEVVPKAVSKGSALRHFMATPPFAGRRAVMIGDDAGDLSALRAAEALGGAGLRVGGEFFESRSAEFQGTAAVRQWLAQVADHCEERRTGVL